LFCFFAKYSVFEQRNYIMWSSLFIRMALCLITAAVQLTLRASKRSKFPADSGVLCDKTSVLGDAIKGAPVTSGVPRNFVRGGGCSTNSVEDRGQGSEGGSPLVRGSGGSCNFVQEISFHIVKSS